MVAFNTVKPGDVLYDCHKTKMGNTTMSRMGSWTVKVEQVDPDTRRVFASWNGNPAKWMNERAINRFRRSPAKA